MKLRHDAPIRIHVHSGVAAWGDYDHDTTAELVDAALAVEAIKHGKVSGYEGSAARCTYSLELLDPAYELKDGELCTCDKCVPRDSVVDEDGNELPTGPSIYEMEGGE